MIFVAENLDSVAKQVLGIRLPVYIFIIAQIFIYVPLAMIRRISRLSFTALIADIFIMFGLLYLYYYDINKLIKDGVSDIAAFNPEDFALFIGTAVFTFEGIGLVSTLCILCDNLFFLVFISNVIYNLDYSHY